MDVKEIYHRLRKQDAHNSASNLLHMAKSYVEYMALDAQGVVLLHKRDEQESYWNVFGDRESYSEYYVKQIDRSIEMYGNYYCSVTFQNPISGEWEEVDGIGMCAGYKDALDPFENYYIFDLMRSAVNAYKKAHAAMCAAV